MKTLITFDASGQLDHRTSDYRELCETIEAELRFGGRIGEINVCPVGRIPWGHDAIMRRLPPQIRKLLKMMMAEPTKELVG